MLGLEFELAADVVRTAIAPSWTDIGQLAAIGAIRTFLNYLKEISRVSGRIVRQVRDIVKISGNWNGVILSILAKRLLSPSFGLLSYWERQPGEGSLL